MIAMREQEIRLFVSSTFADFARERHILQHTVFPALRAMCRKEGFRFQAIDLRWGVSREASLEGRTLSICYEEISRCQAASPEFNLLILLGERYGSRLIPEAIPAAEFVALATAMTPKNRALFHRAYAEDQNATPSVYVLQSERDYEEWEHEVMDPLGSVLAAAAKQANLAPEQVLKYVASATHLEIHHGLLDPLRAPEAALCALRSFVHTPSNEVSSDLIERDPERHASVQSLRDEVRSRIRPSHLLEYEVESTRMGIQFDEDIWAEQMLEFLGNRVHEVIAARKGRGIVDPVLSTNTRIVSEHTAHFIGRAEPLTRIANYIEGTERQPLVITGPSGIGKSALLAEAVRRAEEGHPGAIILQRYVSVTPGTSSLRELLAGLSQDIAKAYHESEPEIPPDVSATIAAFPKALQLATEDRPLILFVDALDQLGEPPQRLDWLPSKLPAHVHFVVSLLEDRPELATLRSWIDVKNVVELESLLMQEAVTLLDTWLASAGRRLTTEQRDSLLSGFASEGRPLYLRLAFELARRWHSFDLVTSLPPTIDALLGRVFEHLEDDRQSGYTLVAHALGSLASARNGLVEDELLDVLAADESVRAEQSRIAPLSPPLEPTLPLPTALWVRLNSDLDPYLTVREADGVLLTTYYHRQLREVVESRYLSGTASVACHAALAKYFGSQGLTIGDRPNLRMLSELAYQQAGAHNTDALRVTLTDARFLQAKIAAQGTDSLLSDLELLREDPGVNMISQAVRAGARILTRKPDELERQVQGHTGAAQYLHHGSTTDQVRLGLRFSSMMPSDIALVRVIHVDMAFVGDPVGRIMSCTISPDGQYGIVVTQLAGVHLYDLATGQYMRTIREDNGYLEEGIGERSSCLFVPGGEHILLSSGRQLELLDLWTGELVRTYDAGDNIPVCDFALSHDGRYLVSAADRILSPVYDMHMMPHIRLWDFPTAKILHTFSTKGMAVCAAISPDNHWIVGGNDILYVWNAKTKKLVHTLPGHSRRTYTCAFSPDGRYLVTGGGDSRLCLWEVATWIQVCRLEGHESPITRCTFTPNGRFIVSASSDYTLRLWNVETDTCAHVYHGHTAPVIDCAVSSDGTHIISASEDTTLRIWEVTEQPSANHFSGHEGAVLCCAFSPSGDLAASGSADGTLRVWTVGTGEVLRSFVTPRRSYVKDCGFTPDGSQVVGAADEVHYWDVGAVDEVYYYDIGPGAVVRTVRPQYKADVWAMSPDLKFFAVGSGRAADHDDEYWFGETWGYQALQIFAAETGEQVHTLSLPNHRRVFRCAFSPDSRYLLASLGESDYPYSVQVWDVASGKMVHSVSAHLEMRYSKDDVLLARTRDGRFQPWDPVTGGKVAAVVGWGSGQLSSDARLELSGQFERFGRDDERLTLTDATTRQDLASWLNENTIGCYAIHPNGHLVIAGDRSGGVHFLKIILPKDVALQSEFHPSASPNEVLGHVVE